MISAACKIEFVPAGQPAIVLVDVDGWLEALPRFVARQNLYEPDGIALADGFIKPLGGVQVDISFTTITEPATASDMWAAFLDCLPPVLTGALVITGGGKVTTFAPAVMTTTTPALPGPDATVIKRYQIQAPLPVTEGT
ncbi:hypothetical protein OKA04_12920 [Luteolibacter flavescens]|uniref:Uncharacterized protein n=1 Tax=Luteolibacter flavescens TaxID=1859460 RepID=A0ABT3FR02_9BACT|nr:hypothetical protein [Luteolibacter flavescens]MCW1885634.1 hypothetical protein [Luteolibacter flavescens]